VPLAFLDKRAHFRLRDVRVTSVRVSGKAVAGTQERLRAPARASSPPGSSTAPGPARSVPYLLSHDYARAGSVSPGNVVIR
jgi:hypothetical protein